MVNRIIAEYDKTRGPHSFHLMAINVVANRKAMVRMNNSTGCIQVIKESFQQGSTHSTTLIMISIISLLHTLDDFTLVNTYADNLANTKNSRNKDKVTKQLKKEADKNANRGVEVKLTFSTSRYETVFNNIDSAMLSRDLSDIAKG